MEGSGWHSECVGQRQAGVRRIAKRPHRADIRQLRDLKKDADVSRLFERGTSFLFFEVDDVDATLAALALSSIEKQG